MTDSRGPFVSGIPLETHVFRTFRRRYFELAITEGSMALVRPHLWDDPFEDLVSRCGILDRSTTPYSQTFLGNYRMPVYAQCWSLAAESDALWRIYSTVDKDVATGLNRARDEEGIKVRTTAGKLLRALASAMLDADSNRCFLGKVNYLPKDQALNAVANEIARSREKAYSNVEGHARSLMTKISAYDHETEVRLVYVGHRSDIAVADLLQIRITPNELFEEVQLDPRLAYHEAAERQAEFERLGYRGEVSRSDLLQKTLYEIPIN